MSLYIKEQRSLVSELQNQFAGERSSFIIYEKLKCLRELEHQQHQHNKYAVLVYLKKTIQRTKFIRQTPDQSGQGSSSESKN